MQRRYSILILAPWDARVRRLEVTRISAAVAVSAALAVLIAGAWFGGNFLWNQWKLASAKKAQAQREELAQSGMPRKGNMKPDSRSEGRKKKNDICTAWSWFSAMVEKVSPTARLAATKISVTASNSVRLPTIGTAKRSFAAIRMRPA